VHEDVDGSRRHERELARVSRTRRLREQRHAQALPACELVVDLRDVARAPRASFEPRDQPLDGTGARDRREREAVAGDPARLPAIDDEPALCA
jgi:hypothetical protein